MAHVARVHVPRAAAALEMRLRHLFLWSRGFNGANEELRTVGVWASVSHGQNTWLSVLVLEVFIWELFAVDRFTTSTVATGEVTTLKHELWNDTMEARSLEMQCLARLAHALFTGAQSAEIFSGLRNFICVKFHGDAASWLATDGGVEKYLRVTHFEYCLFKL